MKHIVVNERVDQVNVVINVVVMEKFMLNLNVILVDVKKEQVGQVIQEIVHVMVMVVKYLMNYVMIVMDVVINKERKKRYMNIFLFLELMSKKKKFYFLLQ